MNKGFYPVVLFLILSCYFIVETASSRPSHHYLSPAISALDKEEFVEKQNKIQSKYFNLREEYLENFPSENVSIYFEDLQTGAWVGISEKELYRGGSLLKVITLASAIKSLNDGNLSLDEKIAIQAEHIDPLYGDLYKVKVGQEFTVRELLAYTSHQSDNTASNALRDAAGWDSWVEAFDGLGQPLMKPKDGGSYIPVSAKSFGNVFRNLYYSGYLSRDGSNYLLKLLSETDFEDGIPAKLPQNVVVSHKIGTFTLGDQKNYHDCGIIYTKNKDYLLCIMTRNYDTPEAKKLIADISKLTYDYVKAK